VGVVKRGKRLLRGSWEWVLGKVREDEEFGERVEFRMCGSLLLEIWMGNENGRVVLYAQEKLANLGFVRWPFTLQFSIPFGNK